MTPGRIAGSNKVFVGEGCNDLHVRIEDHPEYGQAIVSAWLPSAEELRRMQEGNPVYLYVMGSGLPPVYVGVAE